MLTLCSCGTLKPSYSDADRAGLSRFQASLNANPRHAPRVFYAGISVSEFDWKYQSLEGWENSSLSLGKAFRYWFNVPGRRQAFISNPDKTQLTAFIQQLSRSVQSDDVLVIYLGTHQLSNGDCLLGKKQRFTGAELVRWLSVIPNQILLLADVCYASALESAGDWPTTVSRIYGARTGQRAVGFNLNASRGPIQNTFSSTRLIAQETLKQDIAESSLMGLQLVRALSDYQTGNDARLTPRQLAKNLIAAQENLIDNAPKIKLPGFDAVANSDAPLILPDRERAMFNKLRALLKQAPSDISMEDGLFLISRIYHPSLNVKRYQSMLTVMVDELRPQVDASPTAESKIAVLTEYLHTTRSLTNVSTPFTEDFLFHATLDSGNGRCSSFTALYLILAERLGLPLTAACLPEHIFVQWEADTTHINIETTENGKITTDIHYRKVRPWRSTPLADMFYMKPLTPDQIMATYLSPLGEILRMRGRFRLAEDLLLLSTTINPGDAEAWNHLGMVRGAAGEHDDARVAYRKAITINPDFAAAWNNMGNIANTLDERLENYRKAVELDPKLGTAWVNLSYTWYAKKNYQMAWTCANRCVKLGMTLKPGYIQMLKRHLDQ